MTALFVAVGFLGAFLATGPELGSGMLGSDASLGLSAAALGAVFYCVRDAVTRFYMKQDDPINLMTASSIVTLLVLVPAVFGVPWRWPGMDELILTGMASILFLCSSLLIATATMHGRLAVIGSTRYTAIIWAALIDGLVFHQWPSSVTLFGASLIVISGLLLGRQILRR